MIAFSWNPFDWAKTIGGGIKWFVFEFIPGINRLIFEYGFEAIADALPTGWEPYIEMVEDYCGYANYWFPVSEAFTLFLAYLSVSKTVALIKFVLRQLPFFGN